MASSGQDTIMAVRQSKAQNNEGEPVVTRERTATGDEGRVRSNLTETGKDILGIEAGDTVEVKVFLDHIEVWPAEE